MAPATHADKREQAGLVVHRFPAEHHPVKAHIVGAGLAGLAAAVELAQSGWAVELADSAARAGGRCRSYVDPQLGQMIDNGNHFVFSGNQAVNRFVTRLGTQARLEGPAHADFAFHDLGDGGRWVLRVNDAMLPWWVFVPGRRAPETRMRDYLSLARLVLARRGQTIGDVIAPGGRFWERMVDPMMLAVLNCAPAQGSAWLAGRFLLESFARGGRACRPMVAMPTLDAVFIDPALALLGQHGVAPRFGRRLRRMNFDAGRVSALDFGDGPEMVGDDAVVILAVPPWIAADLVPGLAVPDRFCSILNAHFACLPPPGAPPITALIGGTAQWVVCHGDRISVTISGADEVIDHDREGLARRIWADIGATLGPSGPMPRWQIVKEKRATFAATPEQDAKRPGTATRWRNLFLAGDWTQTRLPATIEGALRSGEAAARLARRAGRV
ncbi:MAG: hydroxysqualene dehydroxylase HpnE [Sphingomonas sp.]